MPAALLVKLVLSGIIVLAALLLLVVTRASRGGRPGGGRIWSLGPAGIDIDLWPLVARPDGRLRTFAKAGLLLWFAVVLVLVWWTF